MKRFRGECVRLALLPGDTSQGGKWSLLFPVGVTRYRADFPGGEITFDDAFLATMVANWEKAGRPELPVDYFHRGESGADGLPVQEKVASGWISDLRIVPAGLEALITWTQRARGFIEADELRYLSPSFSVDGNDKQQGGTQGPTLHGAALLNDPFLTELPRVAASAVPPTTAPAATTPKEQHMDKKQICANLGLPEDATDEMLAAAFAKAKAALAAPPPAPAPEAAAVQQQAAALADKAEKVLLANTALAEKNAALEKRLADIEASAQAEKLTALANEMVSAKKVPPAQRDSVVKMARATTIDEARAFFSSLPTISIPTEERGHGGQGVAPGAESVKAAGAEAEKTGLSKAEAMRRHILANPTLVSKVQA